MSSIDSQIVIRESEAVPRPVASANASSGRLARNVVTSYLATALAMLTTFFTTPLLLHALGAERFGLWTLLLSIMGYVGLLEVGLSTTITRRVADCIALEDKERLNRLLGTAFALYLGLMALAVAILGVLALCVGALFHLTGEIREAARLGLLIFGFYQCAVFLIMPQTATLFGAGRFDLVTLTTTCVNVGGAIANVILALRGYGIVALCISNTCAALTTYTLTNRLMARHIPGVHIRLRYASPEMARDLFRSGSRNMTVSLAGTVAFGSDTLIIGLLLPLSSVAQYMVASKLVDLVKSLSARPISVLLPAFAHAEAQQDRERQFRLLTESISLAMIIALPFAVAFCVFGDRLIGAWVGPGHASSYPIGGALALVMLFVLPGYACGTLLTATERNLYLARLYVVAALVNLTLSYTLTRQWGAIGPAVGSLITVCIVDFTVLPIVACRQFGFGYGAFLRRSFGTLPLPLGVALAVALAGRGLHFPPGRILTALWLLGVLVSCWLTWFAFGMGEERRQKYLRSLRAVLHLSPESETKGEALGKGSEAGVLEASAIVVKTEPGRIRLEFLDGIRGLAAFYVLLFHIYIRANFTGTPRFVKYLVWPFAYGHYAVSVFIVLSGFCLMLPVAQSVTGQLKGGAMGFFKRRTRRILPPYYAAVALSLLWIAFYEGLKYRAGKPNGLHTEFSAGNLISHLLLIFNLIPDYKFATNGAMWSVASEWQIYFLFPAILLPVWRRFGNGAALAAGFALGLVPHYLLPPGNVLDGACSWYVGLFALGMVGAVVGFAPRFQEAPWKTRLPWGTLAVALFALFCSVTAARQPSGDPWDIRLIRHYTWMTDVLIGVATVCLILHCVRGSGSAARPRALRLLESPWCVTLGAFSYSLYLMHSPILDVLVYGVHHVHLPVLLRVGVMWGAGIPFVLGLTYLFYRVFERPFVSHFARPPQAAQRT